MGVAFKNIEFVGGLSPGFTIQGGSMGLGEFQVCLGDNKSPLKFQPPDEDYRKTVQGLKGGGKTKKRRKRRKKRRTRKPKKKRRKTKRRTRRI